MDKQSAINLIRETFENSFEKGKYINFIKNLFNKVSLDPFEFSGQYIPETFKPYINKYERVGKYVSEDKRIDILIVHLNRETSIERARTMQRNFVAGYLTGKYGSDTEKDAAVVAFVSPELDDWRLSLVKMEYKLTQTKTGRTKGEEEFTPARRYSFLVGKNEPNHTAQQQLLPILQDDVNNPTLDQLEEAFSVEKVTKEFLNKYRELYLQLKDSIDKIVKKDKYVKEEFEKKKIKTSDFAKKLLGQIVFLYFLQKKGWLGVPKDKNWGEGDRNFLRSLFKKCSEEKKNFFNDYLEILFYDTLNNSRTNQADSTYSEYFNCRVPFLNGGLFEPVNNYNWKKTDIVIPNELFSNNKKTDEGDVGTGILDVFDRYNFTVQEDEPLEKEVALDPELLGKVFENLIEENLRKGLGAYYTPREIVHYMCQESLINYLATECEGKVKKEDIEILIKYGDLAIEYDKVVITKNEENPEYNGKYKKIKMPESIKDNAKLIDEKLANIRVCDPAVGSGAFPVGMMLEIVKARNVLTNYIVTQPSWLSNKDSILSDYDIYFDYREPIGIHKRNLPHWEQKCKAYFVTFRLYDSIPKTVADNIRQEREYWLEKNKIKSISDLNKLDKEKQIEYYHLFSKRYNELLDNGYGSCVLVKPECKKIVEDALKYFEGERYILDKYIIMPNHVHVIVIPKGKWTLSNIMHSWKSYTSNKINKLLGREGELWLHESFDHIIRNPEQLERIRKYIEDNSKVTQTSSLSNNVTQPSWLSNSSLSNTIHKQDACVTKGRTPYNFKRHCIENCLYGVDIDSSAIDIAKLRFWLSLIVDEEDITKIKPLPNLDYKLICGNSLLGVERDLLNNHLFNELERLKSLHTNETDMEKKQELKSRIDKLFKTITNNNENFDFEVYFSEVFREKKGFDVVIANPPYKFLSGKGSPVKELIRKGKIKEAKLLEKELEYITKRFPESSKGCKDLYKWFIQLGTQIIKEKGIITYITPNTYITLPKYADVRNIIINKLHNIIIVDLGFNIFEEPIVATAIFISQKIKSENKYVNYSDIKMIERDLIKKYVLRDIINEELVKVEYINGNICFYKNYLAKKIYLNALKKMKEYCKISEGEHSLDNDFSKIVGKKSKNVLPIIRDDLLNRYCYAKIVYLPKKQCQKYDYNLHNGERIFIRKTGDTILCVPPEKYDFAIAHQNLYVVKSKMNYINIKLLLALFSSKLLSFLYQNGLYGQKNRTLAQFRIYALYSLPIVELEKIDQKPFIALVDKILAITKDSDYLQNKEKQAKVKEYERQIDQMVYKLYGLTEEEIKIVEGE